MKVCVIQPDDLGVLICEAFGLDPSTILGLTLRIDPGRAPRLDVVHHAEVRVAEKLVDFTRVAKSYRLEPIESESA